MYQYKIRQFYKENIADLTPQKQFHFVSRLNLIAPDRWTSTAMQNLESFFLYDNSANPQEKLCQLGYTIIDQHHVNAASERMPYFNKYPWLFGYELQLFQVLHASVQYHFDLSQDLLRISHPNFDSIDKLANDPAALASLSTYLVDVFYLRTRFIDKNETTFIPISIIDDALKYPLPETVKSLLNVYLITHCIIGETLFYSRNIASHKRSYYHQLSKRLCNIAYENWHDLTIDSKLEIALCLLLTKTPSMFIERAVDEAEQYFNKKLGFISDPKMPHKNDISWAEHRNVLYLMVTSKIS